MGARRVTWPRPALHRHATRYAALVLLLVALVTQSACAIAVPFTAQRPTPTNSVCSVTASHAGAPTYGAPASQVAPQAPLAYGTNLSLYDESDDVVNEPTVQALLRIYGVPIIRMPFRSTLSDAYEVRAMQAIRSMGALPLLIIHGPTDVNALADDVHIMSLVKGVFGDTPVYIEFGNEPELAGISAQAYAAAWNTIIPCLKSLAPTYKFVGPANSFFNPEYVATFDRLANPRPDFNSWHEYACANFDSNGTCMRYLNNWTTHITDMNRAVRAATGKTIPIMITEWNLDDRPDPRYQDVAFIQSWTAAALNALDANRANGLYAAMQYCVTDNPSFGLINSSGFFTPAGQAFFQALRQARAERS